MAARIDKDGSVAFETEALRLHFDRRTRLFIISDPRDPLGTVKTLPFEDIDALQVISVAGEEFDLMALFRTGARYQLCATRDRDVAMRLSWHLGDLVRCAVEVEVLDGRPAGQSPIEVETLRVEGTEDEATDPVNLVPPRAPVDVIVDRRGEDTIEEPGLFVDRRQLAGPRDAESNPSLLRSLVGSDTEESLEVADIVGIDTPVQRPRPFQKLVEEARRAESSPRRGGSGTNEAPESDWWESFQIHTDLHEQISDEETAEPPAAPPAPEGERAALSRSVTPRARPLPEPARPTRKLRPRTSSTRRPLLRDDSSSSNPG